MRNESDKFESEKRVFLKFASAVNLAFDETSLEKGDATVGEPDIRVKMGGETVYFELTEACVPEFAAAVSEAIKRGEMVGAVWGADVSFNTVRRKLSKSYSVSDPVELLLYTDGFTGSTDEMLAGELEQALASGLGPFRRIWLLGDEVSEIAAASAS